MRKLFIYALTGSSILLQLSCSKELGKLPENAKVDANTILDQNTAQIALNGAYYRFANVNSSTNTTTWISHQVPSAMYSGFMDYGYGSTPDVVNNYVDGTYGNNIWPESYLTINAANGVIKGVEALADASFTANRKKEILSEARFMRAYGHFKLLSYFGEWFKAGSAYGVFLRNDLSDLTNIAGKRSTVQESYTSIIADLDYAIANGPAQNLSYYSTKWTAMALKMRVLMSRGGTADYTEVISLANNIITNSPYLLETNVKDIFYTKGLSSKEVMMGVKPQLNQELYYYCLSHQYFPGASSLFVATGTLKDLYTNDPRGAWVVGTVSPYANYTPNSFYFTKYIQQGSLPGINSETSYPFRLSEVYLLKAEAIIRSGGSLEDARVLLRNIMGHGGVTDFSAVNNATTSSQLLIQTYYEIARSLVGEDGQEWMALLRLPFATVQQIKPTIDNQIKYILPVPKSEHQQNPAFGEQNPGYGW